MSDTRQIVTGKWQAPPPSPPAPKRTAPLPDPPPVPLVVKRVEITERVLPILHVREARQ